MSMHRSAVVKTILEYPLVPVYFNASFEITKGIVEACYEGGIRAFEFTNRGEAAPEVFKELSKYVKANFKDMVLGIGTVVDAKTAENYIAMGANFIVQPGMTEEVGEVCKSHDLAWIPGVMTPAEIYKSLSLGADAVKIFPGNILGSAYVKALRGPMPNVKIMVTGGVEPTEKSIKEWFGAGANAVGLGSQLFNNMDDIASFKENLTQLFKYI